jgi:hypothetical protein
MRTDSSPLMVRELAASFLGRGNVLFNRMDDDGNYLGYVNCGIVSDLSVSLKTTVKTKEGGMGPIKEQLETVEVGPRAVTGKMILDDWLLHNVRLAFGNGILDTYTIGSIANSQNETHTIDTAALTGKFIAIKGMWQQVANTLGVSVFNFADYDYSTTPPTKKTLAFTIAGSPVSPVENTDYEVDYEAGLVRVLLNTILTEGAEVSVTGPGYATVLSQLSIGTKLVRGKLLYVGNNTTDPRYRIEGWDVIITPATDISLITEDFGKLTFDLMFNSDSVNHPLQHHLLMTQLDNVDKITRSAS